jgi:Fur family ferric uptake transcriptional regulator
VGEFHHPKIETLQKEVAKKNKFKVTSHRMILYGICDNCQ